MPSVNRFLTHLYVGVPPYTLGTACTAVAINRAMNSDYALATASAALAATSLWSGYKKSGDYRRIRAGLEANGWDERIVKPKMYTWCQRHTARTAARHAGYGDEFDAFAEREGHKWYHILHKVHRFHEVPHARLPLYAKLLGFIALQGNK